VGLVGGATLLDLDYEEDAGADVDFNVVMTGSGGLVEVQGTAEGRAFTREQLNALLDLATRGVAGLVEAQRVALAGA
jgi:ribonuclease PH